MALGIINPYSSKILKITETTRDEIFQELNAALGLISSELERLHK